jgi:SAM-dependent methyltransferase
MDSLKRKLRRFPALYKRARLLRFLAEEAWFAGWVWAAPRKFMDHSHIKGTWSFDTPEARVWHRRVLDVVTARIGGAQWGDTLEIGCSEGAFTSFLAGRCRTVDACDISAVARARAAERCVSFRNVRISSLDLAQDEIPQQYDLVFAMDILSCVRGRKRLTAAARKLANALRDGGVLVYTDNSMPQDVLRSWGSHRWWGRRLAIMEPDDCIQFLQNGFGLQVVHREQYLPDLAGDRDELIALFQKLPFRGSATALNRSPSHSIAALNS